MASHGGRVAFSDSICLITVPELGERKGFQPPSPQVRGTSRYFGALKSLVTEEVPRGTACCASITQARYDNYSSMLLEKSRFHLHCQARTLQFVTSKSKTTL